MIAKVGAGYQWRTQWTLNNIVRFGPSTPPAKPSLAFIKDANLRACVADALKGADPKTLTYLDCDDKGVATLAGVEQLTALQGLGAQGGSITDLSPVKGLQLQQLAFGGNNVESLAPLAGNPNLSVAQDPRARREHHRRRLAAGHVHDVGGARTRRQLDHRRHCPGWSPAV